MILNKLSQFWAKRAPRKRILFSWAKIWRTLGRNYSKALLVSYAFLVLISPFTQVSPAHAPVLAAEDMAQIKREEQNKKLREELRRFLRRYNSVLGEEYISAVIAVENKYQMPGFSKLATAVALNESYLGKVYPQGSYNIWGLGASTPNRWISYGSWEEGATDFYRVIRRLGMKRVTYQELLKVSRPYVGTANWKNWGNKIWKFYQGI